MSDRFKKSRGKNANINKILTNKKYLAVGASVLFIGGVAVLAGVSSNRAKTSTSKNTTANSTVNESTQLAESIVAETDSLSITDSKVDNVAITPLSANGAVFPALNIALPDTEPIPEFLRLGTTHSIVADLQRRLMELGFMENDEPTEYFGSVTEAAVKVFQRQNNLAQDGIIGHATLDMIMANDAKYYAAKNGDTGSDIARIQNRLYELGYLVSEGEITGNFGDKTEEAVKKMQSVNSLEQDGKVGLHTLNLIYSDEVKANMLAYGEKSDIVLAVQKRLYELGYMTSTPDGTYGEDTNIAVKIFQSKNDQVVDGYLGPSTRLAIMSNDAKANGLTLGDSNEQVIKVQSLLAKWGYMTTAAISGYYGESTVDAVKAFQSRNSISADGSVGAMTIAKLTSDNVVRPAPPETRPAPRRNNSNNSNGSKKKNTPDTPQPAPAYTGGGGVGTLISVASSQIGTPYVWGGKSPGGFDCSGFVYWALNHAGVSQSYLTSSGWRGVGRYTRISNYGDLRAGDIIVVSGHVGIVAGGGEVIDASSSNGRVVRRSLSGWWANNFIVGWRIF